MGAFIPDPYFNVYGPTKAYELFLSEAMYGELQGTGVTVSALCPGPTKTGWAANAGKADAKIAKDPGEVAESRIYRHAGRKTDYYSGCRLQGIPSHDAFSSGSASVENNRCMAEISLLKENRHLTKKAVRFITNSIR
jgi:hypothetical protein